MKDVDEEEVTEKKQALGSERGDMKQLQRDDTIPFNDKSVGKV